MILLQGSPREIFARPDILRQANLEPPLLVELFAHLSREGNKKGRLPRRLGAFFTAAPYCYHCLIRGLAWSR
ncbi:Uncharacterized [Moorella glycerini]|uniref:Uncharacterized protein n=1 Tax=Neomoorella stamsii TaxID=1266720 RepID=A0A9X7J4R1_9FIRM|nr:MULTISPECIES: hypothetical protein [Moorella]PRR76409.1 hypothetical protein MOST_05770 [Moorella stamsii]CEP67022.1 Uncharacterized [Moorella glycerini]